MRRIDGTLACELPETPPAYALAWAMSGYDYGDPWGSLMGATGTVCDAITLLGGVVPPALLYRPAPGLSREWVGGLDDPDESGEWSELRGLLALVEEPDRVAVPGYPTVTVETLQTVAEMLSVKLDAVPEARRY